MVLADSAACRPMKAPRHRTEPRTADPAVHAADIEVFLRLAQDAAAGRKRFLVTHSGVSRHLRQRDGHLQCAARVAGPHASRAAPRRATRHAATERDITRRLHGAWLRRQLSAGSFQTICTRSASGWTGCVRQAPSSLSDRRSGPSGWQWRHRQARRREHHFGDRLDATGCRSGTATMSRSGAP